jgi:hypothetical protein
VDERVREEPRRAPEVQQHRRGPGPDAVGEHAERGERHEAAQARDGEADADLGDGEPGAPGVEHRGPGDEQTGPRGVDETDHDEEPAARGQPKPWDAHPVSPVVWT